MKIIKLMKGLYKYIVFMLICSIVQVFCELKLPSIMSNIVDNGIGKSDTSLITKEAFIMAIITLIGLVSSILVVYSTSKFANKYGYNIRKSLYAKINTFSKKEIDSFGASTLITRSTNNVSNITSTFSFGLRLMIFAPIMGIGSAVMAYKASSELAPVIVISVAILFVTLLSIFLVVFPKFEKAQKLLDALNAKTREILTGIRVIKAFNKEKYFKKRFDKVNDENMKLNIFLSKILYLINPLMILTINVSTIVIVYISARYISEGTIQVGTMMAFIQYMATVLISFLMLLVIILNIPRVIVSFKRINEILNINPSIKSNKNLKIKKLESLEFKNVYFKYPGAKEYMLKNINFRIEKGESVGIIGSSGSGKTTIINLLLRHIDPTKGSIMINGIDIKDYEISSLRDIYSYTPQKALLFKGTIEENLSFENNYKANELNDALKIASIDDFIHSNEEGFKYNIEQSAVNLSGGQKQRMSIARALLKNGEILLFDDSFSAVDYITDKKIRTELKNKYNDKMLIIVTQRVGTIKDSDKIIVIEEGKIESIGKYNDLKKTSNVFKEFILSQKEEL